MIIIISIGGSVLISDLDPGRIQEYAQTVKKLSRQHTVYVVVGGGKTARDYISAARALGANEVECDIIGIDMTRINARLLIAALGSSAYPEPVVRYQDAIAIHASQSGKIIVMGGMIPGQTTDAVSAVLAEYVKADLLINATSVDGVYTKDPKIDENAMKLTSITPSELVEIVMRIDMTAGSNSPMDPMAAKIIQRCGIKTIVIDGKDPNNINEAVAGRHNGTLISNK
jgi:uridylate kinase